MARRVKIPDPRDLFSWHSEKDIGHEMLWTPPKDMRIQDVIAAALVALSVSPADLLIVANRRRGRRYGRVFGFKRGDTFDAWMRFFDVHIRAGKLWDDVR